ncbi:MAG: RDD family protein, partial [bacterium]|nr:RDD family protein [bacterium]
AYQGAYAMEENVKSVWTGFWRRLGGFLIDGLVLGLVGYGAGSLTFDTLAALDGPTRLIGLAVGMTYFGFLSSGMGGSRTLGMRVTDVKVVAVNGRPLGLLPSLWRALILQAPLMLNGMMVELKEPLWATIYSVATVTLVFGITFAQIILLLFNRPSRRLVHDLLSGAIVVRADVGQPPVLKARGAIITVLVVVILTAGAAQLSGHLVPKGLLATINSLTAPQDAVAAMPEVLTASVQDNTNTFFGSGGSRVTTRTLIVSARLRVWPKDQAAAIERIGRVATSAYRLAPGQKVRVTLTYGYDIGIASGWRSFSDDFEPKPIPLKPSTPVVKAESGGPGKP